jgi:hypothetical protein
MLAPCHGRRYSAASPIQPSTLRGSSAAAREESRREMARGGGRSREECRGSVRSAHSRTLFLTASFSGRIVSGRIDSDGIDSDGIDSDGIDPQWLAQRPRGAVPRPVRLSTIDDAARAADSIRRPDSQAPPVAPTAAPRRCTERVRAGRDPIHEPTPFDGIGRRAWGIAVDNHRLPRRSRHPYPGGASPFSSRT